MHFLMRDSFIRHLLTMQVKLRPVFCNLRPDVNTGLNARSPLSHQEKLLRSHSSAPSKWAHGKRMTLGEV